MIEVGVHTKGIMPERTIEEGYRLIAEAGFTKVDFSLDTYLKNSDIYAGRLNPFFDASLEELLNFARQHKYAMEKNGLSPSQMHAPYPYFVYGKEKQNEYTMKNVIPKSLAFAREIGAPWTVIHPAKLQYRIGRDGERAYNLSYFKSLIPLLKEYKIGACVENLYESVGGRITEGVCSNVNDAIWYVDTLNDIAGEELFGICMDTGHLQLTKRDAVTYIQKAGKRIKILHLHENDGIGDLHQMPYTFAGDNVKGLDWDAVMTELAKANYDGTLSFETFPCMNTFMEGMDEIVLHTICKIGEYFRDEIIRMKKENAK